MKEIFNDYNWDLLMKMLIRAGIMEKRDIDRSGRRQYLYMITESPENLLTSLQDPVFVTTKKIKNFVELFRAF
jgi:predicted transcriptional regulator